MKHRPDYTVSRKPIHGFTLIELLVVIAIIALLMSIIMPALKKVKDQAKFAICGSNQRQIVLATASYSASNEGEMPPHMGEWFRQDGRSFWGHPWHVISSPQASASARPKPSSYGLVFGDSLPSFDVWYCPLAPYDIAKIQYTKDGRTMTIEDLYQDDLSWLTEKLFVSIGSLPLWRFSGFEPSGGNKSFAGPKRQSDSTNLIFTDNVHYSSNAGVWRSNHPFDGATRDNRFYTLSTDVKTPFEALGKVKYNAGYKDGHVEKITTEGGLVPQSDGSSATYYIPRKWH